MEIKITNNQILKVLEILSWIIFIGLCVEAGAIIVNTIITLFINPLGAQNFWKGADYLSNLYQFNKSYFVIITIIMCIVAVLKAIMFFLIIKLFINKTLDFYQPFSLALRTFMVSLSYLSLGIALFCHFGKTYSESFTNQGLKVANLESLNLAGSDVWLFMTIILFILVHIVKKGIDIQTENELTI